MSTSKDTIELFNILNTADSDSKLEDYLANTLKYVDQLSFVDYFNNIVNLKGLKKSQLIELSDIHREYAYQILNGSKKPSRDNILKLCFGGKLTLIETERALALGKASKLYVKDPRDSIVIFCINKGLDLINTNIYLEKNGLASLGSN